MKTELRNMELSYLYSFNLDKCIDLFMYTFLDLFLVLVLKSTSARSGYHYIDYFEVTQLNNARDTINF